MPATTVLLHIEEPYRERFMPWLDVGGRLADAGFAVAFRKDGEGGTGDINVIQTTFVRKPTAKPRRLLDHRPILYERSATEIVSPDPGLRALLADERVRAHLKDTLPRDPALHNAPTVERRLHLGMLSDLASDGASAVPQTVALDERARAKIGSFQPIYMFPRMAMFVGQPNPPLALRPIDVAFAGTVEYDVAQVTRHRRDAIAAIGRLGCRTRVIEGNRLSRADYRALLADTKIFVSPYGYGGFSWKDFEALYMGAIVVKPDCSFTTTYGFDPYGPRGYLVTCRPDFADLAAVVGSVLDDLPRYAALAERNRAAIHAARDLDSLAEDLVALFGAVRDGGPLPPVREFGRAA